MAIDFKNIDHTQIQHFSIRPLEVFDDANLYEMMTTAF